MAAVDVKTSHVLNMFMKLENDVNIQELYYWSNLHEDYLFNSAAGGARLNRRKIADLDRALSPVYRTKRSTPGPVNGQRIFFRLKPLPSISVVKGADKGTLADSTESTIKYRSPSQTDSKLTCQSPQQATTRRLSDGSPSTPIPVIEGTQPTGKILLRRPSIVKPEPLKQDDELFDAYVKISELTLLRFKKSSDLYKFYHKHYPLLLEKIINEDRILTPTGRRKSPISPLSVSIPRKLELSQRVTELEEMVDELEKGTESDDVNFRTELRHSVFDPTSWSFAKEDRKGMMRRYTMEAVMKEING